MPIGGHIDPSNKSGNRLGRSISASGRGALLDKSRWFFRHTHCLCVCVCLFVSDGISAAATSCFVVVLRSAQISPALFCTGNAGAGSNGGCGNGSSSGSGSGSGRCSERNSRSHTRADFGCATLCSKVVAQGTDKLLACNLLLSVARTCPDVHEMGQFCAENCA